MYHHSFVKFKLEPIEANIEKVNKKFSAENVKKCVKHFRASSLISLKVNK
jgi:hypothetical protein